METSTAAAPENTPDSAASANTILADVSAQLARLVPLFAAGDFTGPQEGDARPPQHAERAQVPRHTEPDSGAPEAREGLGAQEGLEAFPAADHFSIFGTPEALPDSNNLLELAKTTEHLARLVEAAQVLIAGEISEQCDSPLGSDSLAAQHGCRNSVELLQRLTRASARTVKQRLRISESIGRRVSLIGETLPPRAPRVATAFTAGDISATCVGYMIDTLRRGEVVAPLGAVAVAEDTLVAAATGTLPFSNNTDPENTGSDNTGSGNSDNPDPETVSDGSDDDSGSTAVALDDDDMRTLCKAVLVRLDQDGPAPKETCREELRGLRFGKERGGLVPISGTLLPEVAALLARTMDAVMSPRAKRTVRFETATTPATDTEDTGASNADATAAPTADGSAVPTADATAASDDEAATTTAPLEVTDGRSPEQKRHDAFASLLETLACHPETPLLGGAPVTVLVQVQESDLKNGRGVGWIHSHDGEPAPVPLGSVRHSSCAGTTMRVTQAKNGRILELGIADRIFNAHQRRALTLRDGGCVIPGCSIPASWCEIHHVTEHANGGPTHTDNGVLLCWYHHRSLDSSGWEIRMLDGAPQVRAPGWLDRARRWRPTRTPTQHAATVRTP